MIDLDKLLELESRATESYWSIDYGDEGMFINGDRPTVGDMEAIEFMRNSIKELCVELKAAREVINAINSTKGMSTWSRPMVIQRAVEAYEDVVNLYEASQG